MGRAKQDDIIELLYKMYNEVDRADYTGSTVKFECDTKYYK